MSTFGEKYKTELRNFKVIFVMGILVHLYVITNKFFNYFEMGNILMDMSYAQGDTLAQGRWFIPVVTNLFTVFSTPLLNGIVCMAYLSAAAVLILKLLKVQEKWYCYLFGCIWIGFPGIASIMSYGVNADVFCFCIVTAVLAVYLCERCRYGLIAGSAVLCLSIGAYQPYLAVAVSVAYCVLLLEALSPDFVFKDFCKKTLRLLVMLILGFVLYYGVLQAILAITGMELSTYHGVDNMTSFTPKGIAKGLVYTYGYFLSYLFTTNYTYTLGRVLWNGIGTVIFFLLMIGILTKNRKSGGKDKGIQMWVTLLMLCLLPLGLNASPFLMADRVGNGVDRYMLISIMLLWGLFFRLFELSGQRGIIGNRRTETVLQWLGVLSAAVVCITGAVICNEAYHRLDATTITTESLLTRIAGRMEQQPEWNKDIPVYFVNPSGLVNDNYEVSVEKYNALANLPGTEVKPWYNERALRNYMQTYLHFPVNAADEAQKKRLDGSKTVEQMPAFPAGDSIQVIDGVMVVKISED